MKLASNFGKWVRIVSVLLLMAISLPSSPVRARQGQLLQTGDGYVFDEGYIELSELGVSGLTGLAYSPRADMLLALHKQKGENSQSMALVNREEELVGEASLNSQLVDALNIAFNEQTNSLFSYDPATQELSTTPADSSGVMASNAGTAARFNVRGAGIRQAQGMDFDPATGRLFMLDAAGKRLLSVAPDSAGNYEGAKALRENRVSRVNLKGIGAKRLRGLALNPSSGNLFTIDPDSRILYEITQSGDLVSTRNLGSFRLKNPVGIVFAPSGDNTDDPAIQSLYVADTTSNTIAELSITPIALAALPADSPVSLVNTIQANNWNPPAPDTAGLSYNPFTDKLFVADSEVDEMNIYEGSNVFVSSMGGALQDTCDTTSFNKEPAGIAVNTNNGNIYFSNDGKKIIYEVHLGNDGTYCTGDDFVTETNVGTYGAIDPEGIEYGDGQMFIVSGKSKEVYVVSFGPNGVLDGAPPAGDDSSYHWDTGVLGLRTPEGIGYQPVRGTLMIVSLPDSILVETSLGGQVQRVFNIGFSNILNPAGVGVGPGSVDSSNVNVYVAQRGVDNNDNPNENDGKIFEFNVGDFYGPPPPPTPTPPPTPVPDLIFADSFESGNLSAWSASTTDGGDLAVTTLSAMVGTQGMQALIDDNNAIFVTDNNPNAEPVYNARFYFDPNSIPMASGDNHFILYGYSGTHLMLRIQFRFSSGAYQVRVSMQDNASAWINTSYFTISDAPHAVEVDWRAATSAGANDGGLTFWIDGVQRSALSGIANGTWRIDSVKLGAVNGIDTGTRGTEFFDAFVSHRQTYIGP